jgi:hypothetical protein
MADRPHDEDDDDFELELEPVDPEILETERRRGQRKTDEAVAKVDIEEIIREKVGDEYGDYYINWNWLREFRFTTRHLLILTAVLAIAMALLMGLDGCSGMFVIGLLALGAGWFAVMRQERRLEAERKRIREGFYASRGAGGAAEAVGAAPSGAPQSRFAVKFSYSMKELLIAMTVASVVLGLMFTFGPEAMAMTLGLIALVGLVAQAVGFDPPRIVVLGWWLLMVFYIIVGVITAISASS